MLNISTAVAKTQTLPQPTRSINFAQTPMSPQSTAVGTYRDGGSGFVEPRQSGLVDSAPNMLNISTAMVLYTNYNPSFGSSLDKRTSTTFFSIIGGPYFQIISLLSENMLDGDKIHENVMTDGPIVMNNQKNRIGAHYNLLTMSGLTDPFDRCVAVCNISEKIDVDIFQNVIDICSSSGVHPRTAKTFLEHKQVYNKPVEQKQYGDGSTNTTSNLNPIETARILIKGTSVAFSSYMRDIDPLDPPDSLVEDISMVIDLNINTDRIAEMSVSHLHTLNAYLSYATRGPFFASLIGGSFTSAISAKLKQAINSPGVFTIQPYDISADEWKLGPLFADGLYSVHFHILTDGKYPINNATMWDYMYPNIIPPTEIAAERIQIAGLANIIPPPVDRPAQGICELQELNTVEGPPSPIEPPLSDGITTVVGGITDGITSVYESAPGISLPYLFFTALAWLSVRNSAPFPAYGLNDKYTLVEYSDPDLSHYVNPAATALAQEIAARIPANVR
jgi:hypothetical protein